MGSSAMIGRIRKILRLQLLPLMVGFSFLAGLIGAGSVFVERQRQDNRAVAHAFELDRVQLLGQCCELGYRVAPASNAAEALRKLDTHPGVALLFTDIVMPGTNGRKLADEALARRPGLKALFTTGFTRNAVVHNGVLDHGVAFIAKPFTLDQLARKISTVLER